MKRLSKGGYSLVEVTLAILVVGVGLLSVFSLFPGGLMMSKKAIDETEAALFAEEVFAGLRAKIEGDANAWTKMDDPNVVFLEAVTYGMWQDGTLDALEIACDSIMHTNIYEQWNTKIVERAIRYQLAVGTVYVGRVKSARLSIWNGQFGPTNNPTVFYTEFYNFGM